MANKYHCTISGGFSFHLKNHPCKGPIIIFVFVFCFFFVSYRSSMIIQYLWSLTNSRVSQRILLSWVDHPSVTFAAITGYKPIRLAPLASGPGSRRRVDHHKNDWSLKRDVCFHSVKTSCFDDRMRQVHHV